ncbi:BnaC01g22460D [Brassica napus]|uniref:BnaC01g22460D protein n=1 Tax=Brassica napus TaxID=3708 RepID=A0A078IEJ8_BRANA|nr:BnaC01g22460D [Brassica napus]
MNVGAKPSHRSLSSLSSLFKSRTQKYVHRNTVLIQSELEVEVRRECKTGHLKLEKALLYFEKLVETRPMPLVDTFNHLLGSVMKLKGASEVISMYKRMKHHGVDPGLYTSNILINAFRHLEKIEYGFCVLSDVLKRGLEPDLVTVDSLVCGLCSQGRVIDAVKVFDEMSERGVKSDATLYGTIIGKLCGAGETGMAVDLHRRMMATGCEGNSVTYGFIISSFVKNKDLSRSRCL